MIHADNLSKQGDDLAKEGDREQAQGCYLQALDELPGNRAALYGMAECSRLNGDTNSELEYCRRAIDRKNSADSGFDENHVGKLLHFVQLLSQAGQLAEAVSAYNQAVSFLNYMPQLHGR